MRYELLSQQEADDIYFEQDKNMSVLGMKWVASSRKMWTSYVMPKSCGVKYPERCYEVHNESGIDAGRVELWEEVLGTYR